MKKLIIAAAAIAAVTLSSGCRHVVVRDHHPVEVVNTRTVVHEHTDVHVHEHSDVYVRDHREPPRETTRIIREVRPAKPEVIYVPERNGRGEPPHHARADDHPRPPAHSNSRYYREKEPKYPTNRYDDPRRQHDPRRHDQHADGPNRPVIIRKDTAAGRAMQEAQRRRMEQVQAPSGRSNDDRTMSRTMPEQRRDLREQYQAQQEHRRDSRPAQVREERTREIQSQRRVKEEHRTPLRAVTERNRTAPPKSDPRQYDRQPPQRSQDNSRDRVASGGKDKSAKDSKRDARKSDKKGKDDKRGKGHDDEDERE